MAKRKTQVPAGFEDAVEMLEDTVQKLENSDLKLDEAIELFRAGVELAVFCNKKLAAVHGEIQKVVEKNNGEVVLTLFDDEEE